MGVIVISVAAGLVFGMGLTVSGMTNPAKVQSFLDLFGVWDPSLAFVMGGALLVTVPGFYLLKGMSRPVLAASFNLPTRKDIDVRLCLGAALFGAGWGLAGFCPGPAIAGLGFGLADVALFVVAMLVGMLGYGAWQRQG